jgi:hypothetical protein
MKKKDNLVFSVETSQPRESFWILAESFESATNKAASFLAAKRRKEHEEYFVEKISLEGEIDIF